MENINNHGHRSRLRNSYIQKGIEGMTDTNILELYLSLIIPQRDVKPLARALMQRFGDLEYIFYADYDELMTVEGIGENTAATIAMFGSVADRKPPNTEKIGDCSHLAERLKYARKRYVRKNGLFIVLLDNKYEILSDVEITGYNKNSSDAYTAVVHETICMMSSYFFVVRFSSDGCVKVLQSDIDDLVELKRMMRTIGSDIVDYMIYSDSKYASVAQSPNHMLLE